MYILTLLVKNILYRRMRSMLTILGVGVSIAAFVTLHGLTQSLEHSVRSTYKARGTDLIIMDSGTVDILSTTIDETIEETIKRIDGVKETTRVLMDIYSYRLKNYILVYAWPRDSYLSKEIQLSGRDIQNPDEVLLGQLAVRKLEKKIGDEVKIRNGRFKVVGIYQAKSVLEDGAVLMDLPRLQALKRLSGRVSMIYVKIRTDEDSVPEKVVRAQIERVQKRIQDAFPALEVKNISDFLGMNTPLFIVSHFTWAISVVAFIIVILGIINTMTTSVMERSKEIGILLAIGWRKTRILSLVCWEALVLGLCGGCVGIALGYGILHYLVSTPQLMGIMRVSYDGVFALRVVGISSVLGLLSGLYPAYKAVRTRPLAVLRYE